MAKANNVLTKYLRKYVQQVIAGKNLKLRTELK